MIIDYYAKCQSAFPAVPRNNIRKSNGREADAKTGVSWREIEVKAEQVDTLMDFVTHVHSGLSGK